MTKSMTLRDFDLATLRRAVEIKTEIEGLHMQLDAIVAENDGYTRKLKTMDADNGVAQPSGRRLHWTQTVEGKARMGSLQRKAWKRRHKMLEA